MLIGPAFIFALIGFIVLLGIVIVFSGIRFIPDNRIGLVEKRWSGRGSIKSGFIALGGEAGFQPNILRGGIHLLTPFQTGVHVAPGQSRISARLAAGRAIQSMADAEAGKGRAMGEGLTKINDSPRDPDTEALRARVRQGLTSAPPAPPNQNGMAQK